MKDKKNTSLPHNSLMSCYLALQSGKFWFPAQVFNRENGHVGFMLSCYDAQLSYGSTSDNFVARYKNLIYKNLLSKSIYIHLLCTLAVHGSIERC
ncbi:F-box protein At2g32560-like isoform X2 [Salvia miltiorrhiza]|uniref:F-box protein At2g32560-like isoform X2 n=1 Tax=Salvia miltiorrhiza TaxID=226208 RepID=UPI0025AB9B3D|nr:F-box protein At2g32560-like isoform X2 [Salvia miltiorrhiza]